VSDTPETEAAWACFKGYMEPLQDVQNLSRKLERERDEAREALSKIDEIFCDGEDTHDDWMKMGNIAKDYFKGLE
jgi:hypothetical protein